MPKVQVKSIAGKDVKELELKESIFGLPSNDALLHQVYVILSGNLRQTISHTKDRAERAGSGKKPWRQKGTGRARVGQVRSPIWRKGGITFGPTKDRNFSKNSNAKMRQKAVMIALSEKVRAGKLIIIDSFAFADKKTKLFAEAVSSLGISGKSVILGLATDEQEISRMSRNLKKVSDTLVENLNVLELLDREYVIVSEAGIKRLEERFAKWEK